MKTIIVFGLLSLLANSTYCQIEGVVIDKKRTAITNAIIIVSDTTGKAIDTVKSDNRGGYFFKGLKPGKYNVEAKRDGFLSVIYKNIELTKAPPGTDENNDTYWAIRLDITLSQAKLP